MHGMSDSCPQCLIHACSLMAETILVPHLPAPQQETLTPIRAFKRKYSGDLLGKDSMVLKQDCCQNTGQAHGVDTYEQI